MKHLKKISIAIVLIAVAISITAVSVFQARATTTNLSLPQLTNHCGVAGTGFTTSLNADIMSAVNAWQVNITFTGSAVHIKSVTINSVFTGTNALTFSKNNTNSAVYAITFKNGVKYTSTSSTTLVTITWKTVVYHASTNLHIVLSSENANFGTLLLTSPTQTQGYTTTDGVYTCGS